MSMEQMTEERLNQLRRLVKIAGPEVMRDARELLVEVDRLRAICDSGLELIRSRRIGLHSPDLNDAIRQVLQVQQIDSSRAEIATSNLALYRNERDYARQEADRLRAELAKATRLIGHYFRVLQGVGKACPDCEVKP